MARPAIKLLKAYAKSLDEKTRVQFYLDILSGEVDFSKYSPDQPRDDHGRFGSSDSSYPMPENPHFISPNNLISLKGPHVGLSDKAKEVASRITNVVSKTTQEGNQTMLSHTATYTSKNGTEFQLQAAEVRAPADTFNGIDINGGVEAHTASGGKNPVGTLTYASVGNAMAEGDFSEVVSRVGFTGVSPDYQRQGLATAMVEFARLTSPSPVMHSNSLSDEGAPFSVATKAFDPLQERDDHGRWTSGGSSDFTSAQLATHQEKYSETYGQDKHGILVGISDKQFSAVKDYSKNGYLQINAYLRTGLPLSDREGQFPSGEIYSAVYSKIGDSLSGESSIPQSLTNVIEDAGGVNDDATNVGDIARSFIENNPKEANQIYVEQQVAQLEPKIASLDFLIVTAPSMGDANLYRVVDNSVLNNLNVGDVMTDKGFTSTTSRDLTLAENLDARNALASIRPNSADTVAVIFSNPSGENRALGVQQLYTATVSDTPLSKTEQEVLLPRGVALQFMGYKDNVGTQAKVAMFQRTN